MSGSRFRTLLVVAFLGAVVAAAVRALRGHPAPQFDGHPSVLRTGAGTSRHDAPVAAVVAATLEPVAEHGAGEAPEATTTTATPADPGPAEPVADAPVARPGPLQVEAIDAAGRTFTVVDDLGGPEPTAASAAVDAGPSPTEAEPGWAAPVDGACPDGYPVKAKASSKIFHQPGGLSYERTRPDRCYPSAAAAEADGFRAAKR